MLGIFGLGFFELLILAAIGSFGLLAVVVVVIVVVAGAQRRPRE
jgi:Sec-independent protein translocase protein TatA